MTVSTPAINIRRTDEDLNEISYSGLFYLPRDANALMLTIPLLKGYILSEMQIKFIPKSEIYIVSTYGSITYYLPFIELHFINTDAKNRIRYIFTDTDEKNVMSAEQDGDLLVYNNNKTLTEYLAQYLFKIKRVV